MKTAKTNRQWFFGFYTATADAEKVIQRGLQEGFSKKQFALILPSEIKVKKLAGVKAEPIHRETRWVAIGALIGMVMASVSSLLLLGDMAQGSMNIYAVIGPAVGGAILGALYGVLYSDYDISLNAYYEESNQKNRIMVGLSVPSEKEENYLKAKNLIQTSGAPVHEYKAEKTASHALHHPGRVQD